MARVFFLQNGITSLNLHSFKVRLCTERIITDNYVPSILDKP